MCAKRFVGCRAGCGNLTRVQDYYAAREAALAIMEYETRLFPGDVSLWKQSHTIITYKDWLIGQRRYEQEEPMARWEFNDPEKGWGWYDDDGGWHPTEHPDAWQVPQDEGPYNIATEG